MMNQAARQQKKSRDVPASIKFESLQNGKNNVLLFTIVYFDIDDKSNQKMKVISPLTVYNRVGE